MIMLIKFIVWCDVLLWYDVLWCDARSRCGTNWCGVVMMWCGGMMCCSVMQGRGVVRIGVVCYGVV